MPPRIFKQIKKVPFREWIQSCAICGASFPPIKILCLHCWKKLKSFYIPLQYMIRLQSSFFHVRLIDWTFENQNFIRFLLKNLKGTQGSLLFEILAQEFCFRIRQLESIQKSAPYLLIPCPATPKTLALWDFIFQNQNSNLKEQQDHSFYWAQALKKRTGYPVEKILLHPSYYSLQKSKNLYERKSRRFILRDKLKSHQNYVFTDDILTSGATAQAAYHALGRPPSFMVWSIFFKKKNNPL